VPRQPKYDANRERRIVDALRGGNTLKAAAAYAGVDETTLHRWRKRYAGFASRVDLAQAEAEVTVVTHLVAAVQGGDVAAAKFWLERRRPDDWGPKTSEAARELGDALAEAFGRLSGAGPQLPADVVDQELEDNGHTP
jgi:hypothetical protein